MYWREVGEREELMGTSPANYDAILPREEQVLPPGAALELPPLRSYVAGTRQRRGDHLWGALRREQTLLLAEEPLLSVFVL